MTRRTLLPRCHENAAEHQRITHDVEQLQPLAEESDRHHRAEHRDQVDERRGAIGPDQDDAAVEKEIAEDRGKQDGVAERQRRRQVEHRPFAGDHFRGHQRRQQQCAAGHRAGEQRERVDLRPFRHQCRIDAEHQQGECQHDVALVDVHAGDGREVAVQQDGEHAGQRNRDAECLRECQPHAEQHQRPQRHEQRPGRLDQQTVQRLGIAQAVIGQHIVGGVAGERQQKQHRHRPANDRPVAPQIRPRHRQDDRHRTGPSDAGQRVGRNVSDHETSEHQVAGPEQRGQAEQQIGLVDQPLKHR